jgi:hypothetical protein
LKHGTHCNYEQSLARVKHVFVNALNLGRCRDDKCYQYDFRQKYVILPGGRIDITSRSLEPATFGWQKDGARGNDAVHLIHKTNALTD